jgi:AcrR family transcriptional regulator
MATLTRRSDAQAAKRAAVEDAVLAATEELLAGGASFAELRVEQIATRAGMSRPAFYFYFRDKRELLLRLTEDVAERLYEEAGRWWSSDGDGEAALRESLTHIVALYREHGVLLRAVVEASAYDETVAAFWRTLVGRFVDATRTRIESEHDGSQSPRATAFALVWMTERACYESLVADRAIGDDELLEALSAIWVASVYGRRR